MTAYEMRISDWSSDVCSSDLPPFRGDDRLAVAGLRRGAAGDSCGRGVGGRSGPVVRLRKVPRPFVAPGVDGDDAVFAVSRHFFGRGPPFLRGRGRRAQPRFGAPRGGPIGGGSRLTGCLRRPDRLARTRVV